ncbi:DNA repair protein complementing XP-C cells [Bagarius yarrelli]|uniref:DNA repair protein complementing XP-C cells n=1 Tax=Bagarius yarrelli TaxID=175774 RepID=A0A556UFF6_BAGYA|nr:DNA repair protein complementing XP-C cells [Bagarius yarrelli]
MAKRKQRTDAVATEKDRTKKKKIQDEKKKKAAPKTPIIKDKDTKAKNIPKATKTRSQAVRKANKPADEKKSKYFSEPLKEEPEDIFEDSNTSVPVNSVLKSIDNKIKEEKKENDTESEESDEDEDWEEVEDLAGPLGPAAGDQEPTVPSQPVEIEIETTEARHKRQKSGLFRNRVCSEPDLLAITLSLVPAHFTTVIEKKINSTYLNGLLKWFKVTFTLNPALPEENYMGLQNMLKRRLGSLSARNHQEMTYERAQTSTSPPMRKKSNEADKKSPEPKGLLGSKRSLPSNTEGQPKRGGKRSKQNVEDDGDKKKESAGGQKAKNTKRRVTASKVSYKEVSSDEDDEHSDGEEFNPNSEEDSDDSEYEAKRSSRNAKTKEKGKSQAPRHCSKIRNRTKIKEEEEEEEDEEEDEVEELKEELEELEKPKGKKQQEKKKQGKGHDEWIEVYLKGAKRWMCVDVDQGVGHPELCASQATQPITYIVGVDKDGYLKDVSSRYDPHWLTSTRKRRINSEWWEETLRFYECPDSAEKKNEDKELQDKLISKPLPKAISEYKNHPLYALERHILKYEALYPATATILGYCRGEAVYSRDCVHTLRSRDTWLKQARTVRLGEKPYKMVKSMSNRSRKVRMMSEKKDENDLALFGLWQTEEYQPPVAINGKIPRNDFGNVYMFKSSMLPVGCAHLHLPNLNKVARKLDLDCKREKRVLANWKLLVKGLLIKERLQRRSDCRLANRQAERPR